MTIQDVENIEINEDSDAESTSDKALEEKYSKQMRQIHPQKIELPISTLLPMIDQQIKLNPEFQRRDRWDQKMRSRFVESIIMNVPIPPVFLGEDKYGSYVVLDGRQRLTAIYEFLKNTYSLEKLVVWSELNGMRFSDIELKGLSGVLKRRFIPAVVLLRESSPEVKYDVFDRLNTGGIRLNPMEIRNAVFQGKFNRLIHKLSQDNTFRGLWKIPTDKADLINNTLYSQMFDVELVLRFFALREPENIKGSFKWWLGHYMETRNSDAENDQTILINDEKEFQRSIHSINKIFGGTQAFVRVDEEKHRKSAPLADAVMVAFSKVDPSKLSDEIANNLKTAIFNLIQKDQEFRNAISTGTNGKGAISTRIMKLRKTVEQYSGVAWIQ